VTVPKLILASSSKARLRVLHDAGIDPEVSVSGVDESAEGLTTEVAVSVLAERKASAVASRLADARLADARLADAQGPLVLGCDSLLDLAGVTLSKPASEIEAAQTWNQLSGRIGTLYTGHCLIGDGDKRVREVAATVVRFGTPSEDEIAAYVSTGEPMSLAGAFSIDGLSAPFIEGIDGDPSNVLGLSLPLLRKMLADFGVRVVDMWRKPISPNVRPVADADRPLVSDLVGAKWGLPVVSVSGLYDPGTLPGIVAEQNGELLGVLTYRVNESDMEVVTLNSLIEGRGIGSALLAEARRMAEASRSRLWLITTNENLRAIAFYQRRGMEIAALHRNFADDVRRAKPGNDGEGQQHGGQEDRAEGIVFRHAIEFEYALQAKS
jgi:septum formation protein